MAAREDNLTAVLYKANDLRLEQRPIPEPKENEVLLKMACVGICGSDVHYYLHGGIGDRKIKQPIVTGHEAAGLVVKLGPGVKNLKVGDRVAIEPGVPCQKCNFCKEGHYNLCPDIFFCSSPPVDGNLCRYYTHAADFCYKLPDHVTFEEGAMLEPLSVGVHACKRGGVTLGSVVLIMGAGPIGLVTLIVAKAMGASKVIITDMIPNRLEVAKQFGADFTLQITKGESEKDTATKVHSLLGEAPNVSIDCCGFESSLALGVQATRSGGVLVIVGVGADKMNMVVNHASFREVDIRGVFRYCNSYPTALALVASGTANVKPLITHNYQLEDTVKAFQNAISGEGNPIKIMIHCNKHS